MSSYSVDYVSGEGYEALVEMRSSIISHVMAKYATEQSWPWGCLLQGIVHPHKMKNREGSFNSACVYAFWKALYEGTKGDDGMGPKILEDGFIAPEDFWVPTRNPKVISNLKAHYFLNQDEYWATFLLFLSTNLLASFFMMFNATQTPYHMSIQNNFRNYPFSPDSA